MLTERSSNAAEESHKLQAELTMLKCTLDNLTQEKVNIIGVAHTNTCKITVLHEKIKL